MDNITRNRANSGTEVSASPPSPPPLDVPWSVVTAGKGKRRTKQQELLSFKPTFVQPRSTSSESSQALSGQTAPASVELVTPYLKGVEKGSVFIDITHVKNHNLLRAALDAFNKDSDAPGAGQGVNDFLGRCEKNRTYLNHVFMETLWAPNTASYHTIVNEGIMLSDNTFIKGFPSYSADASISLILALAKKDGYYVGGGYATIAIPPGKPCTQASCQAEHRHFTPLDRTVPWEDEDGDLRKITLHWDTMPDFCRCCGFSAHCRADCPDRLSWLKCFNCHEKGHEWKHCPRNNTASGTEAPSKARAVPTDSKKAGRKTPLKVNNSTISPMIVDLPKPTAFTATGTRDDAITADAAMPTSAQQFTKNSADEGRDTLMLERAPPPLNPHKNRSQSPEPEGHMKLHKSTDDIDIADSRKQQSDRHVTNYPVAANRHTSVPHSQGPEGQGAAPASANTDQPPPPNQQ